MLTSPATIGAYYAVASFVAVVVGAKVHLLVDDYDLRYQFVWNVAIGTYAGLLWPVTCGLWGLYFVAERLSQ